MRLIRDNENIFLVNAFLDEFLECVAVEDVVVHLFRHSLFSLLNPKFGTVSGDDKAVIERSVELFDTIVNDTEHGARFAGLCECECKDVEECAVGCE